MVENRKNRQETNSKEINSSGELNEEYIYKVEHYVVELNCVLGKGAFGTVTRAFSTKIKGKQFACKIMRFKSDK